MKESARHAKIAPTADELSERLRPTRRFAAEVERQAVDDRRP